MLVPINFRLAPEEVKFIVEHSGARVLYIDPELTSLIDEVQAEHTFVLGEDEHLFGGIDPATAQPREWEPERPLQGERLACANGGLPDELRRRLRDPGVSSG